MNIHLLRDQFVGRNWRLLLALAATALLSGTVAMAQTTPAPATPSSNVEAMKALRSTKKKKAKTTQNTAAEAKESGLAAIVTKHQKAAEAKRSALHTQVKTLLKNVPTDPEKLLAWRKELQAALDAEREAVTNEDAAMHAEVDKAAKRPVEGND